MFGKAGIYRRIRACGLCALLLLGVAAAGADEKKSAAKRLSDAAVKAAVKRYVDDLGSSSRRIRVRAEQGLIKLGPRALPHLPAPELTPTISVREAVRRVLIRLERAAAVDSVKPSKVQLSGNQTLKTTLQSSVEQTGNAIDFTSLPADLLSRPVQVPEKPVTFWTLIHRLSQTAGVEFSVNDSGNGLVVKKSSMDGSSKPLAVDTNGAFRVTVLSADWKPLVGDDDHRLLRVRWSLTAEPRLRPLFLKYSGRNVTAAAQDGKPLEPFDAEAKFEIPATEGAGPIRLRSDFLAPKAREVSTITFGGQIQALTAAGEEAIAFNVPRAKGAAKRRGGVTVTVQDVHIKNTEANGQEKQAGRLSLGIAVSYDVGGPAFESHRTWIFHNRAYLETAKGKRIPAEPGLKTVLQRDGAVGVVYEFHVDKATAATARFVYVAPTLLIKVPVKFTFSKVPVPEPNAKRTSR